MRLTALLVLLLVGCSERAQPPPPPAAPIVKPVSYRVDPQLDLIATELLRDEAAVYAAGGDSLLGRSLPVTSATAADVAALYSENQVAGDQRYFGKQIFLTGVIGAINSGIGNTPYVVFRNTGFIGLQAHLPASEAAEAGKLKKGQRLALICTGGGAVTGVPIFKDCQFAEKFATAEGNKIARSVEEFFQGKQVADDVALLAIHAENIARGLDDADTCSKGCLKSAEKQGANRDGEIGRLILAMRDGGLVITPSLEARLSKVAQ